MSNETRDAALAALKKLESKGVRSVYLDGARAVPAPTAKTAPAVRPVAPPHTGGLAELSKTVSVCTRCELHKSRKQTVFGVGNPNAKLMFIGEAPGADEDAKGEPFVGRAGQL